MKWLSLVAVLVLLVPVIHAGTIKIEVDGKTVVDEDDNKGTSSTTGSYPMVDPNKYRSNSAEKAFAEYLVSWKNQDWARMVQFTQKTWRSEESDPEGVLEAWYDFKVLLGTEITNIERNSDVSMDITVKIYYSFFGKTKTETITGRVICENKAYQPDRNGDWGVNPISTLN